MGTGSESLVRGVRDSCASCMSKKDLKHVGPVYDTAAERLK